MPSFLEPIQAQRLPTKQTTMLHQSANHDITKAMQLRASSAHANRAAKANNNDQAGQNRQPTPIKQPPRSLTLFGKKAQLRNIANFCPPDEIRTPAFDSASKGL